MRKSKISEGRGSETGPKRGAFCRRCVLPKAGDVCAVNPPNFSWRPQEEASTYALQISQDDTFEDVVYEADDIVFNVHTPTKTIPSGSTHWRFRYRDSAGAYSDWSLVREFSLDTDVVEMPLPDKSTLIDRIPKAHPRLFLRPEDVEGLRSRITTDLGPHYDALVEECKELLEEGLPTEEPPLYDEDMVRGSDPWRAVWWGNRRYTQKTLNGAATLAFTWLLDGNEAYAREARRILLACADWDPRGSTGYRYNDGPMIDCCMRRLSSLI